MCLWRVGSTHALASIANEWIVRLLYSIKMFLFAETATNIKLTKTFEIIIYSPKINTANN